MNEIAKKLRAAKALIEDPKHWTQGAYARSAKGRKVDFESKHAYCFCAAGAAFKVDLNTSPLANAAFPHTIVFVNDYQGHAAVMAMYDRAIANAEPSV